MRKREWKNQNENNEKMWEYHIKVSSLPQCKYKQLYQQIEWNEVININTETAYEPIIMLSLLIQSLFFTQIDIK